MVDEWRDTRIHGLHKVNPDCYSRQILLLTSLDEMLFLSPETIWIRTPQAVSKFPPDKLEERNTLVSILGEDCILSGIEETQGYSMKLIAAAIAGL
jgi:hypothetical protein